MTKPLLPRLIVFKPARAIDVRHSNDYDSIAGDHEAGKRPWEDGRLSQSILLLASQSSIEAGPSTVKDYRSSIFGVHDHTLPPPSAFGNALLLQMKGPL